MPRQLLLTFLFFISQFQSAANAQQAPVTLTGTKPLMMEGDIPSQLVDVADRFLLSELEKAAKARPTFWKRNLTSPLAYNQSIATNRARLAFILGVRDTRIPATGLHMEESTSQSALVGKGNNYHIYAISWPAFADIRGEGLMLVPSNRQPIANIIALPHADNTPEELCGLTLGIPAQLQYARRLAESGCRVVVPLIINRQEKRAGINNREWLYRSAFEMGRTLTGLEIGKILAVVDCFEKIDKAPIGVFGWGDGGMLALYAAALDTRITATGVSGHFENRNVIWQQPLDRNVFGLLEQFGDAELATMIAPRKLIVEFAKSPEATKRGGNGGPYDIITPKQETVETEYQRALSLINGLTAEPTLSLQIPVDGDLRHGRDPTLRQFLGDLSSKIVLGPSTPSPEHLRNNFDPAPRHVRQMHEIERHTQALLRESHWARQESFWNKIDTKSVTNYEASAVSFRNYFYDEIIGRFPNTVLPPAAQTRKVDENPKWTRYEVVLDVFDGVFAYGLLTIPKNIGKTEQRPVVVCQHGLEGTPQDVIGEPSKQYYKAFATELAERGFITFAPQNLYKFKDRFRTLQRKANPLKKTLFSIITPQHQQIVDWLQTLPNVDPKRIGFYGLSYGGKTAMRVPALVTDYALSICSADFNEWVDKNASTRNPRSYINTGEYEIFEYDLGHTFNYAEMAALICPRPFMVERGHTDGVADDWTVAWEYSRVRFLYAHRLKIPDKTEIEWFDGPHTINGKATYDFLHRHLAWPKPSEPKK